MASFNKTFLLGRIGRIETKTFTDGNILVEASVATDRNYKDRRGEYQKQTVWHNVVLHGKVADFAAKYVHKGDLVFVEGELQSRKYTNRDQVEVTIWEIHASSLQHCGGNTSGGAQSSAQGSSATVEDDDDLDF